MDPEKLVLRVADYAIITTTLVASIAIGIYFQFANKKKTNEEYLLAGKDMSIVPVAFSMMATFMSATNLMGLPAEMYLFGTNMTFMNLGFIIGPIISAYLFLPIFFSNEVSTAYEYLEKRFGKITRKLVSAMFAVNLVLFTSATLYAPALALSAVTDLSMWISIIAIGSVCTLYSTLGGMKAVIWTDVFQAMLMYTCLIAIIIKGCMSLGGLYNIFTIANDGGRILFPSVSFDMTAHYTIFNIFAQSMIIILSSYGGSQISVQRLLTLKNQKRSRIVSFLSIPMLVSFQLLCCLCGLIFYAYFRLCDPMTAPNKPIHSVDQLMPYFITSTMSDFPGLPGLCISGIFSASLSTVSSAVNSLAAVTSEDFIQPIFPKTKGSVICTKIISLFYGVLCVSLSFLMASLGNLIKMTILIVGMFAGPNLAVFLLAACTTAANEEGVIIGIVTSLAIGAFLSFAPNRKMEPHLPLSNECPLLDSLPTNSTFVSAIYIHQPTTLAQNTSITSLSTTRSNPDEGQFPIAYMWISSIGLISCLVVGYFCSIIINFFRGKPVDVPEIYLSPIRTWFSRRKHSTKSMLPEEKLKNIEKSHASSEISFKSVPPSNHYDTKL